LESSESSPLRRIAFGSLAIVALVVACRTVPAVPHATALEPAADAGVSTVISSVPVVLEPAVRIGVVVEVGGVSVASRGGVLVWLNPNGPGAARQVPLARATFVPAPGAAAGVRLEETGDEAGQALVAPQDPDQWLEVGDGSYRGLVEVRVGTGGTLTAVNVVNVEDYVRGVVPNELSAGAHSPLEALKAQAVAARTYALGHLGDYSSRGYDLCATAACQVYRGAGSESPQSDRAVAETRGVLATWRGRPIHAYYTSACGGHTESGRAVFEDRAPYLRGVACVPEDHGWSVERERAAHGVAWQIRLTPAQVRRSVARYGTVGSVRDIAARRTGASGRVLELAVMGADGEMLLKGLNVRWGLRLPENLFVIGREMSASGAVEHFVFTGLGRGHGVGLCQLGAAAMARAGASYEAILKHYYTGISLSGGA
jgi:stage II sporulation protein D